MLLPPPPPSDCCFSFSSLSLGCRSQTDSLILVREESRWVGVAAALAGRPPRSILFAATAAALSAGSTRWMAAFSATAISFFSRAPRGFSPDVYLTFGCLVFFFLFFIRLPHVRFCSLASSREQLLVVECLPLAFFLFLPFGGRR